MRKLVVVLAVAVLALATVAAPAVAARGGNGNGGSGGKGKTSGSSLTLVLVTDANGDGQPNWGDRVTFEVTTTRTDRPFVRVNCYQSGVHVYWASAGFFEGYSWPWTRNFTLASTYWTEGAADCTATLYWTDGRRSRDLASLSFQVFA